MRGRALFIAATCAIFPTRWRDLATFVQKLQRSPSSMYMSHLELRGKMGGRVRDVCKVAVQCGKSGVRWSEGGGGRWSRVLSMSRRRLVPRDLFLGVPSTLSR